MPIELRNISSIYPNSNGTITVPADVDITGTPAPTYMINGVPLSFPPSTSGASTGDVLTVNSSGGMSWTTPSGDGLPSGGTDGQVLVYDSSAPSHARWSTPSDAGLAYTITVLVSSQDILDLATTPKIIVPAPGPGRFIIGIQAVYEIHQGSIPFVGTGSLFPQFVSSLSSPFAVGVTSANLTAAGPNRVMVFSGVSGSPPMFENEPLRFFTTLPYTGPGSNTYFYAHILYRVIGSSG